VCRIGIGCHSVQVTKSFDRSSGGTNASFEVVGPNRRAAERVRVHERPVRSTVRRAPPAAAGVLVVGMGRQSLRELGLSRQAAQLQPKEERV
jgi:hypothetical protein